MEASEAVAAFAKQERMFRRVLKIVVAVSGGADSLATLLLLLQLKDEFGFEVSAAHFDHKLRDNSGEDLKFVRQVCDDLGVKCMTGEGDIAEAAEQSGDGIEATARKARYEFLAFAAGRELAEAVATGHTFDDQAETVLQRIVRGTGIRGLRGMLPVSPLPSAEAIRLVRPLLSLRRDQAEAVCKDAGIIPLTDPSNEDLSLQRNKVRHETLPALRELNPSIDSALVRLAMNARESFAPVEDAANMTQPDSRGPEGSVFSVEAFRGLSSEGRTLLVEREASFHQTEVLVNHTVIENLEDILRSGTGSVAFGETVVDASCGLVRVGKESDTPVDVPETVLTVPGVAIAGAWRVMVATDPIPAQQGVLTGTVSMSASSGSLLRVRGLQPEDRLQRTDGARKISNLLADAKIPSWERRAILAVATKDVVLTLLGAPEGLVPPVDDEDALYIQAVPLKAD